MLRGLTRRISIGKKRFTEFRCGYTGWKDAYHFENPVEVSTPQTSEEIYCMALSDQILKISAIAKHNTS